LITLRSHDWTHVILQFFKNIIHFLFQVIILFWSIKNSLLSTFCPRVCISSITHLKVYLFFINCFF
jgi:uncharacterized membrane protein YwaF